MSAGAAYTGGTTNNTFIGFEAGKVNSVNFGGSTSFGYQALANNTIGTSNTAIGSNTLANNLTGNFNTALGCNAGVASSNLMNAMALGYGASVYESNTIRLGNEHVTTVYVPQYYGPPSDGRIKVNVSETVPGLSFIKQLRPVTYTIDPDRLAALLQIPDDQRIKSAEEKQRVQVRTGFIAQEVEAAAEALSFDFDGVKKPQHEKDKYSLSYASFVVPLVKAVQEQQVIIEALKQKLEEQQILLKDLMSQKNL